MNCKEQKFFLEAAKVRFGREHCRSVVAVADVLGSLDGTYFDLNGQDPSFFNEGQFVLAINSDPSIAGKTAIIATVASDATAEEVASAMVSAINSYSGDEFRAKIDPSDSTKVNIENRFSGVITAETDSGLTGFTFAVEQVGSAIDLGKTSGAVEFSKENNTTPIELNQTASVVNAEIFQGETAEVSAAFAELTPERIRALFNIVGGEAQNAGGDYVVGGGTSKLFQDLGVLGGQLVIHPQRLPDNDYSRDLMLWASAPKPESLNYDGTALQESPTTFTAYIDERYIEALSLYAIGDWTKRATVDA